MIDRRRDAMKSAGAITNRSEDFKILNLCELIHHVGGRGPFMVTQDGSDPNDPTMRACSFVMTKRGTWLHFYLYLLLPESVRARHIHFETIADLLAHAGRLPSDVVVETAASVQELVREAGYKPGASDVTGQAVLQELEKRHEQSAG